MFLNMLSVAFVSETYQTPQPGMPILWMMLMPTWAMKTKKKTIKLKELSLLRGKNKRIKKDLSMYTKQYFVRLFIIFACVTPYGRQHFFRMHIMVDRTAFYAGSSRSAPLSTGSGAYLEASHLHSFIKRKCTRRVAIHSFPRTDRY